MVGDMNGDLDRSGRTSYRMAQSDVTRKPALREWLKELVEDASVVMNADIRDKYRNQAQRNLFVNKAFKTLIHNIRY
jgi:5-methylthioribose kinase